MLKWLSPIVHYLWNLNNTSTSVSFPRRNWGGSSSLCSPFATSEVRGFLRVETTCRTCPAHCTTVAKSRCSLDLLGHRGRNSRFASHGCSCHLLKVMEKCDSVCKAWSYLQVFWNYSCRQWERFLEWIPASYLNTHYVAQNCRHVLKRNV